MFFMSKHKAISEIFIKTPAKKAVRAALLAVAASAVLALAGCGGPVLSESDSPGLAAYEVRVEKRGDGIFAILRLSFDRPVAVSEGFADELRLTVGGERVKSDEISVETPEAAGMELCFPIGAVSSGKLELSPAGDGAARRITSPDGRYAAKPLRVSCLIPSGMTVETVSREAGDGGAGGSVTVRVLTVWDHRGIAWIRLSKDGKPVAPDGVPEEAAAADGGESVGATHGAEILDMAVAVHGHDYQWETNEGGAAAIAEAINRHYAGRYSAVSEGDTVTVTEEAGRGGGPPDLEIYLY
jgi:hypothetical protein